MHKPTIPKLLKGCWGYRSYLQSSSCPNTVTQLQSDGLCKQTSPENASPTIKIRCKLYEYLKTTIHQSFAHKNNCLTRETSSEAVTIICYKSIRSISKVTGKLSGCIKSTKNYVIKIKSLFINVSVLVGSLDKDTPCLLWTLTIDVLSGHIP